MLIPHHPTHVLEQAHELKSLSKACANLALSTSHPETGGFLYAVLESFTPLATLYFELMCCEYWYVEKRIPEITYPTGLKPKRVLGFSFLIL